MKTTGQQKIKTAVFILVALAVLGVIIFFIGRQKSMFTNTFSVHSNFKNVSGLQVGNFVRFDGINVGTVSSISIINDTTVKVNFTLQSRVKQFIKSDSKATIASDGLMGDKLVEIQPGSDSATELKGEALPSVEPMAMDKIMAKIGGIASDGQVLISNLAGIVSKVNNGQGSLGRLLNDDRLEKSLENTIQTTNQTVSTIKQAAGGINDDVEATKHSFLFRGYFKKKEQKRIQDSIKAAKAASDSIVAKKKH